MISQAPQLTIDDSLTQTSSSNLQHFALHGLLAIMIFGGWVAAWMLILGLGWSSAVVLLAGFAFYGLIPASRVRPRAVASHVPTSSWEARSTLPLRHTQIR